ncbi:MAG TPA: hypothetical protein VHJ40_04520 [Actinomycetota bacterium]|nr:hypothetical protein [Actinomycetota bacterium]
MEIKDGRGRTLNEVTIRLNDDETVELLVAASQLEDASIEHAMLRDKAGSTLAVYRDSDQPNPLQRGADWWLGLAVLLLVVMVTVGAYTIARGIIALLF